LRDSVQEESYEVLTAPDIPSLLIETAFVTNPQDEARLRDPAFRGELADALYAGLLDYYRTNAPLDTYLARNPPAEYRGPVRHVIARGETLSEIAERYRISLRELRRTNRINGDVIRIGQVLTIPTG
ncbi:MAG TPA: LysM peptidoglycan-binding domain-containing protein, partial [Gammaproteobacteria bacterium]